jgi:hypothetical protein
MAATAPGSYLVIAHGSSTGEGLREAARRYRGSGAEAYNLRGPEQLARLLQGLDLVLVDVLAGGARGTPARPDLDSDLAVMAHVNRADGFQQRHHRAPVDIVACRVLEDLVRPAAPSPMSKLVAALS